MKSHGLITLILLSSPPLAGAQDLKIDAFAGGQITWSNTVPDAVYQLGSPPPF